MSWNLLAALLAGLVSAAVALYARGPRRAAPGPAEVGDDTPSDSVSNAGESTVDRQYG